MSFYNHFGSTIGTGCSDVCPGKLEQARHDPLNATYPIEIITYSSNGTEGSGLGAIGTESSYLRFKQNEQGSIFAISMQKNADKRVRLQSLARPDNRSELPVPVSCKIGTLSSFFNFLNGSEWLIHHKDTIRPSY
jgi:hypothetical protein